MREAALEHGAAEFADLFATRFRSWGYSFASALKKKSVAAEVARLERERDAGSPRGVQGTPGSICGRYGMPDAQAPDHSARGLAARDDELARTELDQAMRHGRQSLLHDAAGASPFQLGLNGFHVFRRAVA